MSICPYCGVPAEEGCSICGLISCPDFAPLEGHPTDENFWRGKRWLFNESTLGGVDPLLAYLSPKEPYYDF